jgi:hypothetical protein
VKFQDSGRYPDGWRGAGCYDAFCFPFWVCIAHKYFSVIRDCQSRLLQHGNFALSGSHPSKFPVTSGTIACHGFRCPDVQLGKLPMFRLLKVDRADSKIPAPASPGRASLAAPASRSVAGFQRRSPEAPEAAGTRDWCVKAVFRPGSQKTGAQPLQSPVRKGTPRRWRFTRSSVCTFLLQGADPYVLNVRL